MKHRPAWPERAKTCLAQPVKQVVKIPLTVILAEFLIEKIFYSKTTEHNSRMFYTNNQSLGRSNLGFFEVVTALTLSDEK